MKEEINSIEGNNTGKLCDLPPGRKAIGSKWISKVKKDENGKVYQHKARLVAQGFSQKFGVDYNEVFAPVARISTMRMMLSIAGRRNYIVNHFDIKSAFLNGELEEELYMREPQGFKNGNKVYRLLKSLYGLKQAARVWNEILHKELIKNDCTQNETDKCLYTKRWNEKVCYELIHVDDILVATNDEYIMKHLMENVGRKFEVKNLLIRRFKPSAISRFW